MEFAHDAARCCEGVCEAFVRRSEDVGAETAAFGGSYEGVEEEALAGGLGGATVFLNGGSLFRVVLVTLSLAGSNWDGIAVEVSKNHALSISRRRFARCCVYVFGKEVEETQYNAIFLWCRTDEHSLDSWCCKICW